MSSPLLCCLCRLHWAYRGCALLLLCATTSVSLPAQTFTVLHTLNGTNGESAFAAMVQATDGNFYGTSINGGNFYGNVFRVTTTGTVGTLHAFCSQSGCPDGEFLWGSLVQATDGEFYGTTAGGGANAAGTVFKITRSGTLTTLYSFDGTDNSGPESGLIQATDGDLYGTTTNGGPNSAGTVFKITTGGALTTLYTFCLQSGCPDGQYPSASLAQATNGEFYGTTWGGGANAAGTVFKITSSGTLTTLHSFDGTDGSGPYATLVQASDGVFYGTTGAGGASNAGTIFEITPSGAFTTLHSFDGTDGSTPFAGLVQATDGDLYGTAADGGAGGSGTVFKITSEGTLTTLYSFCTSPYLPCPDGQFPSGGLIQATDGTFYGTTNSGGYPTNAGIVFSLSVGLGPFVETQTSSGIVGGTVRILGANLAGSTRVTFNGTAAAFKVVSASLITATVPAGASTGFVSVVTPSGVLKSNQKFRVTP